MQPVSDQPGLPRILLIGDSISIGYTPPVRELLKGIANVHRPLTNCESTRKGLNSLNEWLGSNKWDLIHFNWGLHDLKYVDSKGNMTNVSKGTQMVPIEEYERNLLGLTKTLKATGARLIWRNTTPVPKGANGRVPGDEIRYNTVAQKIMQANSITVEDMHTLASSQLEAIQQKANVHFTTNGYMVLAKQVTNSILTELAKH